MEFQQRQPELPEEPGSQVDTASIVTPEFLTLDDIALMLSEDELIAVNRLQGIIIETIVNWAMYQRSYKIWRQTEENAQEVSLEICQLLERNYGELNPSVRFVLERKFQEMLKRQNPQDAQILAGLFVKLLQYFHPKKPSWEIIKFILGEDIAEMYQSLINANPCWSLPLQLPDYFSLAAVPPSIDSVNADTSNRRVRKAQVHKLKMQRAVYFRLVNFVGDIDNSKGVPKELKQHSKRKRLLDAGINDLMRKKFIEPPSGHPTTLSSRGSLTEFLANQTAVQALSKNQPKLNNSPEVITIEDNVTTQTSNEAPWKPFIYWSYYSNTKNGK